MCRTHGGPLAGSRYRFVEFKPSCRLIEPTLPIVAAKNFKNTWTRLVFVFICSRLFNEFQFIYTDLNTKVNKNRTVPPPQKWQLNIIGIWAIKVSRRGDRAIGMLKTGRPQTYPKRSALYARLSIACRTAFRHHENNNFTAPKTSEIKKNIL